MLLYKWTRASSVDSIMQEGLREQTYREVPGVCLSAHPTAWRTGRDDVRLVVELPDSLDCTVWLDPVQLCGQVDYIIPAAVLREHGTIRIG